MFLNGNWYEADPIVTVFGSASYSLIRQNDRRVDSVDGSVGSDDDDVGAVVAKVSPYDKHVDAEKC